MQNSNSGTTTLDDFTAHSFEKGFYSSPFNIVGDRIGKYGDQCFSMIAVHKYNGITYCHHVNIF